VKTVQTVLSSLVIAAVLIACSSTESDWNKASTANTAEAYQDFLTKHPTGAHAQDAHDRIQKLADDKDWSDAQQGNTLDAYQQYLQKQPNGAHVADAHAQVDALNRAADWKTAQAANTEPALQEFLQKYNQGPEVDQARAALQKLQSEGYRVELASFKDEKAADKARDSLKAKFGSELNDVEVVPPSGSEKQHRVASTPMTEADAKAACAKLKKAHQHCEVVKR
jgi:outer membrane protein assembly factor BamD (BamD/ComL family)